MSAAARPWRSVIAEAAAMPSRCTAADLDRHELMRGRPVHAETPIDWDLIRTGGAVERHKRPAPRLARFVVAWWLGFTARAAWAATAPRMTVAEEAEMAQEYARDQMAGAASDAQFGRMQ